MKKRDLPLTEYLDVLQKEYVVAELRHKIYPKIIDKQFWLKVMDGKKKKIDDICFRNDLRNIFEDDQERKRIYSLIYNLRGFPNFIYKNDDQRLGDGDFPGLQETDINFYFYEDSEVRVDKEGQERFLGKIIGYTQDRKTILVQKKGTEKESECDSAEVTRIL